MTARAPRAPRGGRARRTAPTRAARPRDAGGDALRVTTLALLGVGPFLVGAVHEAVFIPLLVGCAVVGLGSWVRARRAGPPGARTPTLPGRRLLAGLHLLVLVQLVPLPPAGLRLVSPGSFAFYNDRLLLPLTAWRPISVSPPDTLRGLAFLAAFSLLYAGVFREFASRPWRRRLMLTVVGAGLGITVVALVQAVSPEPRKLYGLWQPTWDWAVFGPYVNNSHFAGYVAMAAALATGAALGALDRLRQAWARRRRGWLVLGASEGNAFVRWVAVVMVLVAGLVASGSRGGVSAFGLTALVLPFASARRRTTAVAVVLLAVLGIAWIGLGDIVGAFATRGVKGSRLDLWADMLPMVPDFPVFGVGWNAFSSAYPLYQTIWRTNWIGEAHNEYLQVLLDGGLVGVVLVAGLLFLVFRAAWRGAARGGLDLGVFGALFALAVHNLVDFNWQIPANAATWVALASLALNTEAPGITAPRLEPRGPRPLQ
ncbi:MAG: O-antigen ligase family protein [Acidobacteria bacterium]|nr:O-antigen ligase family protein [Acidobacteriota bacterium]